MNKIIVKITHPENWFNHGHWHYKYHTHDGEGGWGNYRFEINNNITECDYWLIQGSTDRKETVLCPKENVIFLTSEEKLQIPEYPQKYLNQFSCILTSRDDIQHQHIIHQHYLCPWWVRKTYTELNNIKSVAKSEMLSAVVSDSTWLEGHKKRYALVNRIQGHFKDRMVWYGKGEKFISDKWDGLKDYKYSVAIENSAFNDYFTEKLNDCFLAFSMPFYWGCPNIYEYFPEKSLILIDRDDYKKTIITIEQAIEENWYEKNYEYLLQARQLVLEKYNFIPAFISAIEKNQNLFSNHKKQVSILPQVEFTKETLLQKIRKRF